MLRKFLDYMMLNEDDEGSTVLEPEFVEEEQKENEMFNKFFEKTEWFWEMLGKTTERISEVFDKLHERMGTFPMLLLVGIFAIFLYALVIIPSFNL